MKRITLPIVLLSVLAALTACEENTPFELNVTPTVDVTAGADIAFKAVGGTGTIQVAQLDDALQVQTAQSDWCHLSVSGNTINVEVDEYDGLESRYAVVEMTAGKATGKTIVHQFGVIVKDYSWKDITVKNESRSIEFPYDADGSTVQIVSDQDWITYEATPEKLVLHIDANPDTDYREALLHWSIGSVSGEFTVGQFDLAAAGLLGEWTWHGKQQPNNRDFPMNAKLEETGEDIYTLSLSYTTTSVEIAIAIEDVVLQTNKLMLPLGNKVGTYTMKRTGVTYNAFPVVAAGTTRIYYANAVTEGAVPFTLERGEDGSWQAVGDMTAYPDMFFRFEMWAQPADEYEEEHDGISKSGLVLAGMYMDKD